MSLTGPKVRLHLELSADVEGSPVPGGWAAADHASGRALARQHPVCFPSGCMWYEACGTRPKLQWCMCMQPSPALLCVNSRHGLRTRMRAWLMHGHAAGGVRVVRMAVRCKGDGPENLIPKLEEVLRTATTTSAAQPSSYSSSNLPPAGLGPLAAGRPGAQGQQGGSVPSLIRSHPIHDPQFNAPLPPEPPQQHMGGPAVDEGLLRQVMDMVGGRAVAGAVGWLGWLDARLDGMHIIWPTAACLT